MSERRALILTNCTNRKRYSARSSLCAQSLPRGSYSTVSAEWVRRIRHASSPRYLADQLYCGRVVTETLRAAEAISSEVAFISAGLGVVPRAELVPAYSLTASSKLPDSIDTRLTEGYEPHVWWKALTEAMGVRGALARFIKERQPELVLVALPLSYFVMVENELTSLPPPVRRALRILGPRRGQDVPAELRSQWLPYDDRLDNRKSGVNGTAGDFPNRALRHFVSKVLVDSPRGSAEAHQLSVESELAGLTPYVRRQGARAGDEEVLAVIQRLWPKHQGHRTRILRELRTSCGVACEQSRFRRLADRFEAGL